MASVATTAKRPSRARALALAMRPKTLPAAIAPVLVGAALAVADGAGRADAIFAAFGVALALQVAANFANDVFDFERGADGAERLGPPRAVAQGWLTPAEMRRALAVAIAAAALPGLWLIALGGWPIALAGALAIAAAVAYTAGPLPLAYVGLGELAVLAFFGMVAVGGTYFVQAGALPGAVLLASLAPGALASAILVVNNLRDRATDRRAGKRTLAVRFGARTARAEYAALVALAALVPIALVATGALGPAALAPLATTPWMLGLARRVAAADGPALNPLLGETARLELVFCTLFAAGIVA